MEKYSEFCGSKLLTLNFHIGINNQYNKFFYKFIIVLIIQFSLLISLFYIEQLKKASANTENKVTILIEDCQQSTTPSENTNPSKAANQTTSPSYFENNFSRGSFKSVPYTINHSEDFENLCQGAVSLFLIIFGSHTFSCI